MLKQYCKNKSGNFTTMLAVGATTLLMGIGVAIDFNAMSSEKVSLQNLADAGVLAAAVTREENVAKLRQTASRSIEKNKEIGKAVESDLKVEDDTIIVTASTVYKPKFMGMFGYSNIGLQAVSKAPLASDTPMNIALVLDRTGSMQGDKMANLKLAAKGMLDTFENYEAQIKASVIPFAQYVNVGLSNRNVTWMDVPADYTEVTPAGVCRMRTRRDTSKCTRIQVTETCENDGVKFSCTKNRLSCPPGVGTITENYCPSEQTTAHVWNGCAGSRANGFNRIPGYQNKKIPGILDATCGEELQPLTTNLFTVRKKIDSLTTDGETYIPAGLIWGWRALQQEQPLNDLSNADKDRRRALVLMTDGNNTKSLELPGHGGDNADAANKLTAELCTAIKNDKIDIYSIAYEIGTSAEAKKTKNMIEACASSPRQYFEADNAQDLKDAFEDIAAQLFTVRLSG